MSALPLYTPLPQGEHAALYSHPRQQNLGEHGRSRPQPLILDHNPELVMALGRLFRKKTSELSAVGDGTSPIAQPKRKLSMRQPPPSKGLSVSDSGQSSDIDSLNSLKPGSPSRAIGLGPKSLREPSSSPDMYAMAHIGLSAGMFMGNSLMLSPPLVSLSPPPRKDRTKRQKELPLLAALDANDVGPATPPKSPPPSSLAGSHTRLDTAKRGRPHSRSLSHPVLAIPSLSAVFEPLVAEPNPLLLNTSSPSFTLVSSPTSSTLSTTSTSSKTSVLQPASTSKHPSISPSQPPTRSSSLVATPLAQHPPGTLPAVPMTIPPCSRSPLPAPPTPPAPRQGRSPSPLPTSDSPRPTPPSSRPVTPAKTGARSGSPFPLSPGASTKPLVRPGSGRATSVPRALTDPEFTHRAPAPAPLHAPRAMRARAQPELRVVPATPGALGPLTFAERSALDSPADEMGRLTFTDGSAHRAHPLGGLPSARESIAGIVNPGSIGSRLPSTSSPHSIDHGPDVTSRASSPALSLDGAQSDGGGSISRGSSGGGSGGGGLFTRRLFWKRTPVNSLYGMSAAAGSASSLASATADGSEDGHGGAAPRTTADIAPVPSVEAADFAGDTRVVVTMRVPGDDWRFVSVDYALPVLREMRSPRWKRDAKTGAYEF